MKTTSRLATLVVLILSSAPVVAADRSSLRVWFEQAGQTSLSDVERQRLMQRLSSLDLPEQALLSIIGYSDSLEMRQGSRRVQATMPTDPELPKYVTEHGRLAFLRALAVFRLAREARPDLFNRQVAMQFSGQAPYVKDSEIITLIARRSSGIGRDFRFADITWQPLTPSISPEARPVIMFNVPGVNPPVSPEVPTRTATDQPATVSRPQLQPQEDTLLTDRLMRERAFNRDRRLGWALFGSGLAVAGMGAALISLGADQQRASIIVPDAMQQQKYADKAYGMLVGGIVSAGVGWGLHLFGGIWAWSAHGRANQGREKVTKQPASRMSAQLAPPAQSE